MRATKLTEIIGKHVFAFGVVINFNVRTNICIFKGPQLSFYSPYENVLLRRMFQYS